MIAITISNPINKKTTPKGKTCAKNKRIPPLVIIVQANPVRTFNKICPLIILAKSRTPKLIIVKKYEITSIITIIGIKANGIPEGKKKPKASILCSRNII